jgi:hypothetical protein
MAAFTPESNQELVAKFCIDAVAGPVECAPPAPFISVVAKKFPGLGEQHLISEETRPVEILNCLRAELRQIRRLSGQDIM